LDCLDLGCNAAHVAVSYGATANRYRFTCDGKPATFVQRASISSRRALSQVVLVGIEGGAAPVLIKKEPEKFQGRNAV
jgi:hypothetical protein